MKKIIVPILALTMLASPLYAEKVKVGFMTTLSGPAGIIGKQMKDAFQLGLDHIGNAFGGMESSVIYGDDQRKPDVAKQLADKMVKKHQVHFVTGIIWSNLLVAVHGAARGAGALVPGYVDVALALTVHANPTAREVLLLLGPECVACGATSVVATLAHCLGLRHHALQGVHLRASTAAHAPSPVSPPSSASAPDCVRPHIPEAA